MSELPAFTRLILSAHETAEQDYTMTPRDEYERYRLVGDWAERTGWDESILGTVTSSDRRITLSGGGGTLDVAYGNRSLCYATDSPQQTLSHLVTIGIVPAIFSPAALQVLEDVSDAHERMASHIAEHHDNPTMTAVAGTWQAAADSARAYLDARQLELAVGRDLAATV